jgi:hypothetical protein
MSKWLLERLSVFLGKASLEEGRGFSRAISTATNEGF